VSIFRKFVEKINVSLQSDRMTVLYMQTGTVGISGLVLLIMRNIADKLCRQNQKAHFVFNNTFFFETRAVFEIMWENRVEPDRRLMST
jgi:hypothetical protein